MTSRTVKHDEAIEWRKSTKRESFIVVTAVNVTDFSLNYLKYITNKQ